MTASISSALQAVESSLPHWAAPHFATVLALTSKTASHLRQYVLVYVVLLVSAIFYFVYRWCLYARFFSPLRHMPGPEYGHWFFGQTMTIIREETGVPQRSWHMKYGPRIRFSGLMGAERVSFTNYNALRQLLIEDPYNYTKPSFVRSLLGIVAGYGLLTLEDREHVDMRRFMNGAFAFKWVEAQFEAYYKHINGLVDILKEKIDEAEKSRGEGEGVVMEVTQSINNCLLDIICDTAFGYQTDHLHNPEEPLGKSFETLVNMQGGANMAVIILFLTLPGGPKIAKWATEQTWTGPLLQRIADFFPFGIGALSRVATFCTNLSRIKQISQEMLDQKLAEAKALRKAGGNEFEASGGKVDVFSLLVKASLDEKSSYRMNAEMIQNQVLTFLGAGHETTASGAAWALWELAQNQRVQNKLRLECQELISRRANPEYQDIKHLKYLNHVVQEVMRLRPPVPHTARQARKTSTIDGVLIPKGTLIYIPNWVCNTDPEVWGQDALEFRPERFDELSEKYNKTFSILTFIAGAHHCIGRVTAENELKALLCTLIANFEFHKKDPEQTVKRTSAITMKPQGGLELLVKRAGPARAA
ncbi:cytochrome P450 [Ceraceosorus guamensis]|uniref:Cytochrome P450 n=1 Tax=Ceraceosorus guamensis TaxID=1522189 RepID=A0A316WCH8_9BASI|nr:cytochrome P450 [Ceraceosorus guamensis]PWN46321.1 cytochrome P450 [Ceraceosorus guamensis]